MSALPAKASVVSKVKNYLKRKVQEPLMQVFWDESELFFVCPVTLQEVPCGPNNKGYPISIPTAALRTVVPALRFGLVVLKIGLATQGLGGVVPSVDGLLPEMSGDFLNAMKGSIADVFGDGLDSVDEYLVEAVETKEMKDAMKFIEPFIRKAEGACLNDEGWESSMCGLSKQKSRKDNSVCWVSEDAIMDFVKNGKAALSANFKV